MSALITESQWASIIGGAQKITDLCDDDGNGTADPLVVSEVLEQASDFVQEYAVAAGAALTAGALTASMKRRVGLVAAYYAASRRPEFRDAEGNPAYNVEYETVVKELKSWASRVRSISTDAVSTGPEILSDDSRGW